MNYIWHQNNIIRNNKCLVANNRAFRYGDGLFESMRYFKGRIPLLDFHLDRLAHGMKILGYKSHPGLEKASLIEHIQELCRKNEIEESARIRLNVYRKEGGLYAPETDECEVLISCDPIKGNRFSLNQKGLILGVAKDVFREVNILSNIKTSNSLINVLAARQARKNKWNDALLLNASGHIAEATSSNLFIIKGAQLITPPLEDGALDGIMRRQVAGIAKAAGLKPEVKSLIPKELEEADEIFLTNAVRGIMYVVGFGKKRYFNKKTRILMEELNLSLGL